jgi:hypothetical protein
MTPRNFLKLIVGLVMLCGFLVLAWQVARFALDQLGIVKLFPEPPGPAVIEVRIDPTLDARDALSPTRPASRWARGAWNVYSAPEEGGWAELAVLREAAPHRVESVELHMLVGQGAPRAAASARWYETGSIPFFTDNEFATDIHGVIAMNADSMPADGEERIIAYNLDGMHGDKPVHFEGKISAAPIDLNVLWLRTEHVR